MRSIRSLYYQLSFDKDDRYIDMCKDLINGIAVQDFLDLTEVFFS